MIIRRQPVWAGVLGAACACAASLALADDLRPTLVLPSQRDAPSQMQQQMPPPKARSAGPAESYYGQFESKARQMQRDQRDALRRDFLKRYESAKRRNAGAEMEYYQRMLGILATIASERRETP